MSMTATAPAVDFAPAAPAPETPAKAANAVASLPLTKAIAKWVVGGHHVQRELLARRAELHTGIDVGNPLAVDQADGQLRANFTVAYVGARLALMADTNASAVTCANADSMARALRVLGKKGAGSKDDDRRTKQEDAIVATARSHWDKFAKAWAIAKTDNRGGARERNKATVTATTSTVDRQTPAPEVTATAPAAKYGTAAELAKYMLEAVGTLHALGSKHPNSYPAALQSIIQCADEALTEYIATLANAK